jgi:inhibitor of KinA sporulation pathway (predicted exonuclease)
MDLEWNSVYGPKIRGYLNEIIEIGAVMLDVQYRELSHFSVLLRSRLSGGRLQTHVREMTNISRRELERGLTYDQAISAFRRWLGHEEHVICTWGDGDIRVMLANARYFTGGRGLNYVQRYLDLQAYFQQKLQTSRAQQVGLAAAGEMLGLNIEDYPFHRALGDSRFAADILRKLSQDADFLGFAKDCTPDFYAELEYKPRLISDINNPLVDPAKLYYICRPCGRPAKQLTEWRFASRGFQALFRCEHCGQLVKANVAFKKLYSAVEIRRSAKVLEEGEGQTEG